MSVPICYIRAQVPLSSRLAPVAPSSRGRRNEPVPTSALFTSGAGIPFMLASYFLDVTAMVCEKESARLIDVVESVSMSVSGGWLFFLFLSTGIKQKAGGDS